MTIINRRTFLASSAVVATPLLGNAQAQPTKDTAWPPYTYPVPLDLRIPRKHPYLTLTPSQTEHARLQADSTPWARQLMNRILARADKVVAKSWGRLAPAGDKRHIALGYDLFRVGLAYAFSGRERYATWVRDGLVAYADLYPRLPLSEGGLRLFSSTLYEAMWLVNIVQAYDLMAGSGALTPQQAQNVEDDLLRLATACFVIRDFVHDPRLKNLHFRCYNFQAWFISSVGLVGLAVKDPDLVDWAINSPYGFRFQVARDIRDDGMFWERSESYHMFVLEAFLPFAEALLHCGMDLYNLTVPTDRMKDFEEDYLTDTSNWPKSLRLMFEPLFYMTFPDLSFPVLGDAEPGPLRASAPLLVGSSRYRDPKLDWLVHFDRPEARANSGGRGNGVEEDWHWLVYDVPENAPSAFPIEEGRFANTGEYRNGCSLFPATGVAILRQASGNYTTQPDSTAISLSYGPHGGGHGHSNNMDVVLYAQGRQWIPAFASMPYESSWKSNWTAQTISNNTMVLDGISQKPTGARQIEWPADTATDRVCGILERFEPQSKAVSAHCDNAYAGVRLRRSLCLAGHTVVDAFTVADLKGSVHQCDYVLHIDGQFERSSVPLTASSGSLGKTCGYQLVEQKMRASTESPITLTFAHEGRRLRIWVLGGEPTEVVIAEGLTNLPDRKMLMLVLRRRASRTRYLAVLEPVKANDPIVAVRTDALQAEVVVEYSRAARRVPLE